MRPVETGKDRPGPRPPASRPRPDAGGPSSAGSGAERGQGRDRDQPEGPAPGSPPDELVGLAKRPGEPPRRIGIARDPADPDRRSVRLRQCVGRQGPAVLEDVFDRRVAGTLNEQDPRRQRPRSSSSPTANARTSSRMRVNRRRDRSSRSQARNASASTKTPAWTIATCLTRTAAPTQMPDATSGHRLVAVPAANQKRKRRHRKKIDEVLEVGSVAEQVGIGAQR